MSSSFESRVAKLEKNVYETVKGTIRLALLEQDIVDYCLSFVDGNMQILDVGGGSGRFSRICAERGHRVTLCDSSPEMLRIAAQEISGNALSRNITLMLADFLAPECDFDHLFDMVVMHGSAEWMHEPETAILKACSLTKPGGYVSLLVFNKSRNILKRGINGLLLQGENWSPKNTLTPPGAMSPGDIRLLLGTMPGSILLQSGIRIFHKFFRKGVEETVLTPEQWLLQEKLYYRAEPFAELGEHTHFIWQKADSDNGTIVH